MFTPVKNILIFLVSLIAMLIIGSVFYAFDNSLFALHLGFIVGFVIGFIIAQMIAEKSFHIFEKLKYTPHFLVTAVAIYIFMFIFTQFGMSFFVNRLPNQNQIHGVFASTSWDPVRNLSAEEWRTLSISNPRSIAELQEIHRFILSEKRNIWRAPNLDQTRNNYYDRHRSFYIQYVMNNGKIVTRQYYVPQSFIDLPQFRKFLDSDEYILSRYAGLKMPELLSTMELSFSASEAFASASWNSENKTMHRTISNQRHLEIIAEMAAQGILESSMETRSYQQMNAQVFFENVPQIWVSIYFNYKDYHRSYSHPFASRSPTIYGEPALRLYQQVVEYGLLVEN